MHFSIFLLLFTFSCVQCKNNVKSLTESMGQEVIEIGTPIKDLPPGLDEEPSAEVSDDERGTSFQPSTRRETRKTTTISTTTVEQKTANDAVTQDEEERRIEKELSEIYKDTDYKVDSSKEILRKPAVEIKNDKKSKPVFRTKTNFKFQPDVNDLSDVERFRTSVDEISCGKRVTQKLIEEETPSASGRCLTSFIAMGLALVCLIVY